MEKMEKDRAEEILQSLTIDQKIRLLNGVGSWNTYDADGKIPVISMSDGPHGLRHQTGEESYANINDSRKATCFPTASAIACSWNVEALEKMGAAIAKEALEEKVQLMLGCGMNIKRSPLCGRNFEYFSEDPYLSGELATAYVNGMQKEGVGACIKHFALNNQEKFRQSSSSNVDERTMREIYLSAFERAIRKAKPLSIMCSYNKINGTYASANHKLLTDILRKEWGFDGIVISDWGADIAAPESLKAGLDLAMPDSNGYLEKQIKKAFEEGSVSEEEINTACRRIINCVLKLNENMEKKVDGNIIGEPAGSSTLDFSLQHQCSYELALESAVLLKNDGFLPLAPDGRKIIVVGELAEKMHFQGGGSSHINCTSYPSALECLQKAFDVIYLPGYLSSFCKKKKKERINRDRLTDAVQQVRQLLSQNPEIPLLYFCGLEESYEGEGFDRDSLSLPESHVSLFNQLASLSKNIILVTFGGSPMDLGFAGPARSILHMYLCGEACGQAAFSLLTGQKNPSGKLAESWPLSEYIHPENSLDVNYKEGVLVGYRFYESKQLPVLYEFGFGLSYTSFEYSDLKLEKCESNDSPEASTFSDFYKLSLTLENTGKIDGSEIVQIYVKNNCDDKKLPSSNVPQRASIELAAFSKVFLKAGEKKRISLTLDRRAFSVWSTKKNSFELVAGSYEICAAASVKDLRLKESLFIEGQSLEELLPPESEYQKDIFVSRPLASRGTFTISDSLGLMAKESLFVRLLLRIINLILVLSSKSKSRDDPAVKIAIAALEENPLESLISTSGGLISEKFANMILRKVNNGKAR